MSEISKRGHDAERNAKPILESLGYQILMELLNEKDEMERKFGRRPVKVVYVRTGEIKYIGRQPSAEEIQLEKKYAKYNKILGDISIPKCVSSDSFDKFIRKSHKKGERTHSYVDYFCKKGKNYYVFDIKHKLFKQNKNLNNFSVTYWEFLNYNRLIKVLLFQT